MLTGKGGKPTDDSDEGAGVMVPDVDEVKADMLQHVERLKKNLAKLRGGDANPSRLSLWAEGGGGGGSPPCCIYAHQVGASITSCIFLRVCVSDMLDHVQVEAYGSKAPLSSVAHVVLRSPSLIMVSPFEGSVSAVSPPPDSCPDFRLRSNRVPAPPFLAV